VHLSFGWPIADNVHFTNSFTYKFIYLNFVTAVSHS